jgi:hypothetical protein
LPDGFRDGDQLSGDKAYTDQARVSFTIKEGPRGEPKIMLEMGEGLPVLTYGDAFLMLHFRPGVTLEEAMDVVETMNRTLSDITYTKFIT